MNKILKLFLMPLLAIGIIGGGYLYAQDFRPIIFGSIGNTISKSIAQNQVDTEEFRLLFCGTGSPNRTPDRGQPCTALVADGKLFLFDAGEGAIGKLIEYGAPVAQLKNIFLTHLHSDHMSGVAEVLHNTWLYGRRTPVVVVGPPGVSKVVNGFHDAYRLDLMERQRVLGAENLDPEMAFSEATEVRVEGGNSEIVYESGGLTIRAFAVDHPDWPHAYGYRIEHQGKVVVISGDTRVSDGVRRYAKNADLLIHEALNTEIFERIGEELEAFGSPISKSRLKLIAEAHTTTKELAQIAEEASVNNLIITHLIPAIPAKWFMDQFFVDGMDDIYKGNIVVARDGQWIDMGALP